MAAKKSARKSAPDTAANTDAADLFTALRGMGAVELEGQGDRDKIALTEPGQYFVAQLVKIGKSAKPNERGERFNYYHFNGRKREERFYYTGSFDFDNRVTDEHIGKVLAVRLVELIDMGKPSPMKVYDVVSLASWPQTGVPDMSEGVRDGDELPF